MASKIKKIIIFIIIATALILVYVFFFKKAPEQPNLISSSGNTVLPNTNVSEQTNSISEEFLALLLSVKSIKLDDSIFANPVFATFHDSSIELILDPSQVGRPIPFAPIGTDVLSVINNTQTNTSTSESGILGTVGATVETTTVETTVETTSTSTGSSN